MEILVIGDIVSLEDSKGIILSEVAKKCPGQGKYTNNSPNPGVCILCSTPIKPSKNNPESHRYFHPKSGEVMLKEISGHIGVTDTNTRKLVIIGYHGKYTKVDVPPDSNIRLLEVLPICTPTIFNRILNRGTVILDCPKDHRGNVCTITLANVAMQTFTI